MKHQMIAGLVLLSVVLVTSALSQATCSASRKAAVESQSTGVRIEGTWGVQVTQRNCQTGGEIRSFPAMLTFARGGTLTGTTTAFPVALRGPDHGVWSHDGLRNYQAVSEAFLFNPAGAWVATQRITQAIELSANADSFDSNASVEFFDKAGNVTATGCATAVARRMQ